MAARSADGLVLIASNRGPVSFTLGDDGQLSAQRGGGGVVSGLSSVAEHGRLAVGLRGAQRRRPGRGPRGARTAGSSLDGTPGGPRACACSTSPPASFNRAYNTVANSTLWFVHHMLYDTPNQPRVRDGLRAGTGTRTASYNQAFAEALAEDAAEPDPVPIRAVGPGLPPDPRAADARRACARTSRSRTSRTRRGRRRLLPAAARRRRRRGARRHTRRRPRRVPVPALGRRVHGLLRGDPRRRRRPGAQRGDPRAATSPASACTRSASTPRELISRAAEPDVAGPDGDPGRGRSAGRKLIVRVDRTELSKNIVRGLVAYRELLVTHPEWHGTGDARGLRLPVPARPARVPRVHRPGAAAGRRDRGRVRHRRTGTADPAQRRRRLPALAGRATGWPTCCW